MDTKAAKDVIQVIRKERKRRLRRLPDDPDAADYVWRYTDEPFVNDLCLMLLVAIHHQVERELVGLAARMTGDGQPLSLAEYQRQVQIERDQWRTWKTRRKTITKLKLESRAEWTSMETLRLLANSNKHAVRRPHDDLLGHLKLDLKRNYAPLAESDGVRERLATSLDLDNGADYCAIAEELLERADRFLTAVKKQPGLSKVRGAVSLRSKDAEC